MSLHLPREFWTWARGALFPFNSKAIVMLEIVALVCTVANPFKCNDIRLPSRVTDSLQTCTELAPADLAKWRDENRAWIVRRYMCAPVNIASK